MGKGNPGKCDFGSFSPYGIATAARARRLRALVLAVAQAGRELAALAGIPRVALYAIVGGLAGIADNLRGRETKVMGRRGGGNQH